MSQNFLWQHQVLGGGRFAYNPQLVHVSIEPSNEFCNQCLDAYHAKVMQAHHHDVNNTVAYWDAYINNDHNLPLAEFVAWPFYNPVIHVDDDSAQSEHIDTDDDDNDGWTASEEDSSETSVVAGSDGDIGNDSETLEDDI